MKLHLVHNALLGLVSLIGVGYLNTQFLEFVSPTKQFKARRSQFFADFDDLAVLTTPLVTYMYSMRHKNGDVSIPFHSV